VLEAGLKAKQLLLGAVHEGCVKEHEPVEAVRHHLRQPPNAE
jgi:hypothetical protein